MRKVLIALLVVALFVPTLASAKDKSVKNDVALGHEKVYVSEGFTQASLFKSKECKYKHDMYYSCFYCNMHKRTPGVCRCGAPLVPSFKHGNTWHTLSRDQWGNLTIDGVAAQANCNVCGAYNHSVDYHNYQSDRQKYAVCSYCGNDPCICKGY